MKKYNEIDTYNDLDIEFKLLSGIPVEIETVGYIHSLVLKQITQIGYSIYNLYISALCFNMNDIKDQLGDIKNIDEISCFDVIFRQCSVDENYKDIILDGLSLFFNEKVNYVKDYDVFYLGKLEEGRFINRDNYELIKKILKLQNCIQEPKEEMDYNPANERARALIEKIKENRKNAPKVQNESNSTLQSIISGVAWKSHVGIYSVWDLTIYQLYDAYYRLEIIDNYTNTFTGIFSGNVDASKMNLKDLSWSKVIKII